MSDGRFHRFVALGDSLTEGVGDEPNPDGTPRGWADRFAATLAERSPELHYANLAVRGRRLAEIRDEQLPAALALAPDIRARWAAPMIYCVRESICRRGWRISMRCALS